MCQVMLALRDREQRERIKAIACAEGRSMTGLIEKWITQAETKGYRPMVSHAPPEPDPIQALAFALAQVLRA